MPLFFTNCSSSKSKCAETRELAIIPSKGIGPYKLGMSQKELISVLCPEYLKKEDNSWLSNNKTTSYFIKNMSFIFNEDRLKAINVWGTFKGSYEDIDVEYDKELLDSYGDVIKFKGEYRILDIPHISFGIQNSDGDGNYIKIFE